MTTPRRVARNLLALAIAEVISKAIGYLVLAYLARTLHATNFGKLSFAQSIVAYFQMLVNLGLDTIGTREVARDPKDTQSCMKAIVSIRLLAAAISFGLLCLLTYLIHKDAETKLLLFYMGLSVVLLPFTLEWILQGIEKMHIIALSRILQQLVYAGLIVMFIFAPGDVVQVPLLRVAAGVCAVLFLLAPVVKWYGWPLPSFDFQTWKKLLTQSLPIGFSLIMVTIYYNSDTVILGFLKSDEEVGWYNAAYRMIHILILPVLVIRTALFPALARMEDRANLEKAANAYVRTMFIVGIPMGFGGTILAPFLIQFIYGSEYVNAVLPFQILSWNAVMVFINDSYGAPLLAWGRQVLYAKIVTASAVTNLVFNFLLIPPFGMIGAAIATILAELVAFAGVYPEFQKTFNVPLLKYATRPIIASIVMSFVLLAFSADRTNFFGLLSIGVGVFVLTLYVIGGLSVKDVRLLLEKG